MYICTFVRTYILLLAVVFNSQPTMVPVRTSTVPYYLSLISYTYEHVRYVPTYVNTFYFFYFFIFFKKIPYYGCTYGTVLSLKGPMEWLNLDTTGALLSSTADLD